MKRGYLRWEKDVWSWREQLFFFCLSYRRLSPVPLSEAHLATGQPPATQCLFNLSKQPRSSYRAHFVNFLNFTAASLSQASSFFRKRLGARGSILSYQVAPVLLLLTTQVPSLARQLSCSFHRRNPDATKCRHPPRRWAIDRRQTCNNRLLEARQPCCSCTVERVQHSNCRCPSRDRAPARALSRPPRPAKPASNPPARRDSWGPLASLFDQPARRHEALNSLVYAAKQQTLPQLSSPASSL